MTCPLCARKVALLALPLHLLFCEGFLARVLLAALVVLAPAMARAQDVPPAPDPVELQAGQPAPSRGVFLTDARADWITSKCAADAQARQDLQAALLAQPGGYTGTALAITGSAALVLGVVLGFVAAKKL